MPRRKEHGPELSLHEAVMALISATECSLISSQSLWQDTLSFKNKMKACYVCFVLTEEGEGEIEYGALLNYIF